MSTSAPLTPERVAELVLANRVIRAPHYDAEHDEGIQFTDLDRGLQWGADAIPALLGLFRVERDPREDRPDGWVGFARHWRGDAIRLAFDRFTPSEAKDPILVVTEISGRNADDTLVDDDLGEIDLPEESPTEAEWEERTREYQKARRNDDSDGAAAVRAYIAALSGWKQAVAAQFDEIVQENVPDVRRAVRYHQPFYGLEDEGWFASVTALTNHVKLSFICTEYLEPKPPKGTGPARQALDVTETDTLDDEQLASWVRQAAADPGMNW